MRISPLSCKLIIFLHRPPAGDTRVDECSDVIHPVIKDKSIFFQSLANYSVASAVRVAFPHFHYRCISIDFKPHVIDRCFPATLRI